LKKITIAIDGHSSTGKSTLAKQLANALGYVYVDTGAMYRAVALYALQNGYISEETFDKEGLIRALPHIYLKFIFNPQLGFAEMFLNDVNVEAQIRSIRVSNYVSKIAEISEVRANLVKQQQAFGKDKAVVMDGRDIGTVVFPNAELKLFMTASAKIRAERRYNELVAKGQDVSFDEVYTNVVERDAIDTSREDSPLVKANDAIELDNSTLSKEEQYDMIYKLAVERIQG
jgi:CMP/dCMP kinase